MHPARREPTVHYAAQVVSTLSAWSCESRNHLRVKMRFLLERVVRKFGYDAVARFVPESDMKLLA